jgi:hypothetical protein
MNILFNIGIQGACYVLYRRQDRGIEFSLGFLAAGYTTAKEVSFVSCSRSGFECSFWTDISGSVENCDPLNEWCCSI